MESGFRPDCLNFLTQTEKLLVGRLIIVGGNTSTSATPSCSSVTGNSNFLFPNLQEVHIRVIPGLPELHHLHRHRPQPRLGGDQQQPVQKGDRHGGSQVSE